MTRWELALLALCLASPAAAADRPPVYATIEAGLGIHPSLAIPWGAIALSPEIKVGIGSWHAQKTAVFADVGLFSRMRHTEAPIGSEIYGPTEQFRLMPLRAGLKWNLRPRPDWLQIDLIAGLSFAVGYREFTQPEVLLGRNVVVSPGALGGIELMIVKYKAIGATVKAQYVVQPAVLSRDGFLTGGFVDLGGPEISFGWVVFP